MSIRVKKGIAVTQTPQGVTAADSPTFVGLTTTGFRQGSVSAALTASTTQSQVGGLALVSEVNNVSTVANANDTVVLPTAVAGREVVVRNSGANVLRIYPASGDDLGNGVNTLATIAVGKVVRYIALDATTWKSELSDTYLNQDVQSTASPSFVGLTTTGFVQGSVGAGLTATGVDDTDALALTAQSNQVTTTAAGTGVELPAAVAGRRVYIKNAGAETLKVYATTGDSVDGQTVTTGNVTQATTVGQWYLAVDATNWISE